MSTELEELYQEVILDHSRRPRNFGALENADVLVHGDNPSCGDEIHLGVHFGPGDTLAEIKFSGQGCAISQASASMMTMKLKGKTRDEASALGLAFKNLVTAGDDSSPLSRRSLGEGGSSSSAPSPLAPRPSSSALGDLQFLAGVRKFPQRVKCAMLPWRAVEQALAQSAGVSTISTEAE
jgi:nitrogen fixation protein NifU and related proteins